MLANVVVNFVLALGQVHGSDGKYKSSRKPVPIIPEYNTNISGPMSYMALDLGKRRIGVAVTDAEAIIVQPFTTLGTEKGGGLPLDEIRALVEERQVHLIVVGQPLRMDGSIGPEAVAAGHVARELERELGVEVVLWDERLTSFEAKRLLIEAGARRSRRKGAADQVAAALILQDYLEELEPTAAGDGRCEGA